MSRPKTPTESIAEIMELFAAVRDGVVGYRTQLEASGFSPTAAEMMATDFHRALIEKMLT